MTPRKIRGPAERMLGYARVKKARDPEVTGDRLRELAGDEIMPVRLYTARSHAAPPDVLLRPACDEDDSVRWCVQLNPVADDAVLRFLVERKRTAEAARCRPPAFSVRRYVVHHPGASPDLRDELLAEGACGCPGFCTLEAWRTLTGRWTGAARP